MDFEALGILGRSHLLLTLPETNTGLKNPHLPWYCKYHQNGGFSMAMLVYRSVVSKAPSYKQGGTFPCFFLGSAGSVLRTVTPQCLASKNRCFWVGFGG